MGTGTWAEENDNRYRQSTGIERTGPWPGFFTTSLSGHPFGGETLGRPVDSTHTHFRGALAHHCIRFLERHSRGIISDSQGCPSGGVLAHETDTAQTICVLLGSVTTERRQGLT